MAIACRPPAECQNGCCQRVHDGLDPQRISDHDCAAEVFSSRCAILTWLILEPGCTSSFIGSACRDQLACTDFPLFYYSELGASVPHLRVGKGVDQYTVRRFLDRLQAEPRYRPS